MMLLALTFDYIQLHISTVPFLLQSCQYHGLLVSFVMAESNVKISARI